MRGEVLTLRYNKQLFFFVCVCLEEAKSQKKKRLFIMYAKVLEHEVECLNDEVVRLWVMLHRVVETMNLHSTSSSSSPTQVQMNPCCAHNDPSIFPLSHSSGCDNRYPPPPHLCCCCWRHRYAAVHPSSSSSSLSSLSLSSPSRGSSSRHPSRGRGNAWIRNMSSHQKKRSAASAVAPAVAAERRGGEGPCAAPPPSAPSPHKKAKKGSSSHPVHSYHRARLACGGDHDEQKDTAGQQQKQQRYLDHHHRRDYYSNTPSSYRRVSLSYQKYDHHHPHGLAAVGPPSLHHPHYRSHKFPEKDKRERWVGEEEKKKRRRKPRSTIGEKHRRSSSSSAAVERGRRNKQSKQQHQVRRWDSVECAREEKDKSARTRESKRSHYPHNNRRRRSAFSTLSSSSSSFVASSSLSSSFLSSLISTSRTTRDTSWGSTTRTSNSRDRRKHSTTSSRRARGKTPDAQEGKARWKRTISSAHSTERSEEMSKKKKKHAKGKQKQVTDERKKQEKKKCHERVEKGKGKHQKYTHMESWSSTSTDSRVQDDSMWGEDEKKSLTKLKEHKKQKDEHFMMNPEKKEKEKRRKEEWEPRYTRKVNQENEKERNNHKEKKMEERLTSSTPPRGSPAVATPTGRKTVDPLTVTSSSLGGKKWQQPTSPPQQQEQHREHFSPMPLEKNEGRGNELLHHVNGKEVLPIPPGTNSLHFSPPSMSSDVNAAQNEKKDGPRLSHTSSHSSSRTVAPRTEGIPHGKKSPMKTRAPPPSSSSSSVALSSLPFPSSYLRTPASASSSSSTESPFQNGPKQAQSASTPSPCGGKVLILHTNQKRKSPDQKREEKTSSSSLPGKVSAISHSYDFGSNRSCLSSVPSSSNASGQKVKEWCTEGGKQNENEQGEGNKNIFLITPNHLEIVSLTEEKGPSVATAPIAVPLTSVAPPPPALLSSAARKENIPSSHPSHPTSVPNPSVSPQARATAPPPPFLGNMRGGGMAEEDSARTSATMTSSVCPTVPTDRFFHASQSSDAAQSTVEKSTTGSSLTQELQTATARPRSSSPASSPTDSSSSSASSFAKLPQLPSSLCVNVTPLAGAPTRANSTGLRRQCNQKNDASESSDSSGSSDEEDHDEKGVRGATPIGMHASVASPSPSLTPRDSHSGSAASPLTALKFNRKALDSVHSSSDDTTSSSSSEEEDEKKMKKFSLTSRLRPLLSSAGATALAAVKKKEESPRPASSLSPSPSPSPSSSLVPYSSGAVQESGGGGGANTCGLAAGKVVVSPTPVLDRMTQSHAHSKKAHSRSCTASDTTTTSSSSTSTTSFETTLSVEFDKAMGVTRDTATRHHYHAAAAGTSSNSSGAHQGKDGETERTRRSAPNKVEPLTPLKTVKVDEKGKLEVESSSPSFSGFSSMPNSSTHPPHQHHKAPYHPQAPAGEGLQVPLPVPSTTTTTPSHHSMKLAVSSQSRTSVDFPSMGSSTTLDRNTLHSSTSTGMVYAAAKLKQSEDEPSTFSSIASSAESLSSKPSRGVSPDLSNLQHSENMGIFSRQGEEEAGVTSMPSHKKVLMEPPVKSSTLHTPVQGEGGGGGKSGGSSSSGTGMSFMEAREMYHAMLSMNTAAPPLSAVSTSPSTDHSDRSGGRPTQPPLLSLPIPPTTSTSTTAATTINNMASSPADPSSTTRGKSSLPPPPPVPSSSPPTPLVKKVVVVKAASPSAVDEARTGGPPPASFSTFSTSASSTGASNSPPPSSSATGAQPTTSESPPKFTSKRLPTHAERAHSQCIKAMFRGTKANRSSGDGDGAPLVKTFSTTSSFGGNLLTEDVLEDVNNRSSSTVDSSKSSDQMRKNFHRDVV